MNRIGSPFGFHTTAEEVIGSLDLRGKRAIVTGGGSGIGAETVRVLAHAGAEGVRSQKGVTANVMLVRISERAEANQLG